jgi:hypothetical protein
LNTFIQIIHRKSKRPICARFIVIISWVLLGFIPKNVDTEAITIINVLTEYIKDWGFCYFNKFANDNMIIEMERAEKSPLKENPLYITVKINGVEILYTENLSLLQKYNTKGNKMKPACNKKSEGGLKFSYPIFSIDKSKALVLVETYCGVGCGANELLVFTKGEFGWFVEKRILIRSK